MSVFQGAGAGQAIEDALILSHVLSHTGRASQIPAAFIAYDAVRRPRSQRATVTSKEAGELIGLKGETLVRLGGLEGVGEEMGRRMEWLWEADIAAMVGEVEERFREALKAGKGKGGGEM